MPSSFPSLPFREWISIENWKNHKTSKPWKPEQNFKILFAPAVLQVWTKRFENLVILFDFPETKAKIYHRTPLSLQKTLFLSAKMLFW